MKSFLKACFLSLACSFCASVCLAETELVSMFREGLATFKTDPAKGAAMVETSVLQCTFNPTDFSEVWEFYKTSEPLRDANNASKITMLDVFLECAQKTSHNCKTRSEFNTIWAVLLDIQALRTGVICEECSSARKTLESLNIETLFEHRDEHREMLEFLLEYTEEAKEENTRFLQRFSNRLANRVSSYETRYQDLKNASGDVNWDKFWEQICEGVATLPVGETTRLMREIRDYLLFLQNPEISVLMERFPSQKNPLERGEKLLEKAQTLNRVRYNIWANWVLYNFGENVEAADSLPLISAEYLYTPVEILFQEKQEVLFGKTHNPAALSDILQRLILEEKVPLTAF